MPKLKTQGDRCKFFESNFGQGMYVMPQVPVLARIDGRAFHTFTRGLDKPFDVNLSNLMVATTQHLVEDSHAQLGYCQSDEISILWIPNGPEDQIFFDGRVQKMISVLAATATEFFNRELVKYLPKKINVKNRPVFDARVWAVPNLECVADYFDWRQRDAVKNSISMVAQSLYTPTELNKKNSNEKQEMIFQRGINWNNFADGLKRGTFTKFELVENKFSPEELNSLPKHHEARKNPSLTYRRRVVRSVWPSGKVEIIKTLEGI